MWEFAKSAPEVFGWTIFGIILVIGWTVVRSIQAINGYNKEWNFKFDPPNDKMDNR